MGTWSAHPMGNDDAQDFVIGLFEAGNDEVRGFIERSLEHAMVDTYRVHEVVAAALAVAACRLQLPPDKMVELGLNTYTNEEPYEAVGFDYRKLAYDDDLCCKALAAVTHALALVPEMGWVDDAHEKAWEANLRSIYEVLADVRPDLALTGDTSLFSRLSAFFDGSAP